MSMSMVCTGCGAPLQMDSEGERGYVTSEAFMRERPLCQRCYRLIHYGEITPANVTDEEYRAAVMRVLSKPSLVLYVVDLFDFNGSLLRGMTGMLAPHEVIIVANKVDLFPVGTNPERVGQWAFREAQRSGLSPFQTIVVSARTGLGFEQLWALVQERSKHRQVTVIGMANVGKSSVLNRLLAEANTGHNQSFTTSPYPGTTLGPLSIQLPGNGLTIVDTPGLLGRYRLQDRVCSKSVRDILPTGKIKAQIFQLLPQQTLFIGGLVRLDFVKGPAQPFVVFAANQLHVHRTKIDNAEQLYERHLGEMLMPPCPDCDESLKHLVPKKMGFKDGQPLDIVIPGLGWIRLSGKEVHLQVHVPKGIELMVRPALIARKADRGVRRNESHVH